MRICTVKLKNNSVSGITILWHTFNEYVPGREEAGFKNGVYITIITDDLERLTRELSAHINKVAPAVEVTVEYDEGASPKGTFSFELETKYRGQ